MPPRKKAAASRTSMAPMLRSRGDHITGYWERSRWPLQSLYFLLPVVLIYEVGTSLYRPGGQSLARILAASTLGRSFEFTGITGLYLPAMVALGLLFFLHLTRHDPWRPQWRLYPLMWMEAFILATPLFVFILVVLRRSVLLSWGIDVDQGVGDTLAYALQHVVSEQGVDRAPTADIPDWPSGLLLSLGAGLYEELLFRLIGITALHLLLHDVFKVSEGKAMAGAVLISAVAFSAYHFSGLGWSHLQLSAVDWARFVFFTLAGVYFGVIFVARGFGIAVATHALYDVLYITVFFQPWR